MDGSSLYTPAVLEVDDLTIENIRSAWTTGKVSTLDDGVEMNEHGVRGETWTLHYASLTSPFASRPRLLVDPAGELAAIRAAHLWIAMASRKIGEFVVGVREPEIEVTEGSDNVFRDLGFPEEEAATLLAQAEAQVAHERAAEAERADNAIAWGPPEIEQDEGDVTVRAFTLDMTRAKSITVRRNSVLVVDTTMGNGVQVVPAQRFSHHAFRPPGQRFGADQVDPAIKVMARGVALAEGHDPDEHWFDADRWGRDVGGPCWLFYTDHAKQALKALRDHEAEHPPRRAD